MQPQSSLGFREWNLSLVYGSAHDSPQANPSLRPRHCQHYRADIGAAGVQMVYDMTINRILAGSVLIAIALVALTEVGIYEALFYFVLLAIMIILIRLSFWGMT